MCEVNGHITPHSARLIVTDRYKYVDNRDQVHELYDLQTDPYEMTNLIDDPGNAAVVLDLKERLERWRQKTADHQSGRL